MGGSERCTADGGIAGTRWKSGRRLLAVDYQLKFLRRCCRLTAANLPLYGWRMKTRALDTLYRASGTLAVDKLNQGLPASVFPELAARLAISTKTLARSLGLSERTLRNRKHKLTGDEAERTLRAYRVFRRAIEVFANEEQARDWLITPQPTLGERKPLDLLVRDVGEHEVLGLLAAVEDGGYL